jgi:hypothetical protein
VLNGRLLMSSDPIDLHTVIADALGHGNVAYAKELATDVLDALRDLAPSGALLVVWDDDGRATAVEPEVWTTGSFAGECQVHYSFVKEVG